MIRKFTAVFALLLLAPAIQAADLDGKLSAVDLKAGTITLPVDGKDQKFALAKDCKVYAKGTAGQRQTAYNLAAGGTAALAAGQTVTITTDFIDGQDTATMVKINSGALGKPVQSVKPKKTPAPTPDPAKPSDQKPAAPASTAGVGRIGSGAAPDATEVQGVVAGVDLRHQMIAVTVSDGKVQRFHILKTATFFLSTPAVGKKGRSREKLDAAPNGLADATVGASVTLTFNDATKKAVSMVKITLSDSAKPSKKN